MAKIKGKWYYPKNNLDYREIGIASVNSNKKENKTKNGEIFSNKEIVAKHKTLALPTIARITNLYNGYSINVRINDRGPKNNFRIIELSKKTADYLKIDTKSLVEVKVISVLTMKEQRKLKKINSNIDFSSDFIIGYPEENDKDFEKTMDLVKKIEFINSYSFIYSARPGTPAAKLQKINSDVTKNRLKIIQNQLFYLQLNKNKELEEKKIEVLVENKLKNQNSYFGRTRKMTPVIFESTLCNPGDLIQVEIISSNQNNLFGKHMENKFKAA